MKAPLYWMPDLPEGRLAIMPRPRGGDWLEDELKAWESAGVDGVLSLLTPGEEKELDLRGEQRICSGLGLYYLSYPIPDRQTPRVLSTAADLIRQTDRRLREGQSIVVHCRMGMGRSAMIIACLLAIRGASPEAAFETIARVRGVQVPDTDEQRQWVTRFLKLWNAEAL